MDEATTATTNTHSVSDSQALRLQLEEDGKEYRDYQNKNPEEAHDRLLHTLQTNDCREIITVVVDGDDLASAFVEAGGRNHIDILEGFFNHGMNIDIKNKYGFTALMYASANEHEECVQFLFDCHASVDVQDSSGDTALIYASASHRGKIKIVEMLLKKNANSDLQNTSGMTALMFACSYGRKDIVQLLLDHNADIELKSNHGERALDLAKTEEIKELLRNHVNTTGYVLK